MYYAVLRYADHLERSGNNPRRPSTDMLMAADRAARLEWEELMRYHNAPGHSKRNYTLIEAITVTIEQRANLWTDQLYT